MKKLAIAARCAVPAALSADELATVDGGDRRDRPRPEDAPPRPPPPRPKWQPQPQYRP
jgi:hypothetical protein